MTPTPKQSLVEGQEPVNEADDSSRLEVGENHEITDETVENPGLDDSQEISGEVQEGEPDPEVLDSVPVLGDSPLHEAAKEGQLLEACPSCGTLMDVSEQDPFSKIHCPSCGQALRARKQFNHYKLLELIGQGGMGQVFKALDCNLNRSVALKVLKRELAASDAERDKLAAEARITASINHPHVVKVFSFGQDHGQFYMAMELIPNSSLDELLALQRRVPEIQVLQIGMQIAEGLQAALEKDLIHRDIKPGNILFADAHTAKLVDFGLAIVMDEAAAAVGEIWGTPYYIAPEKLDNQPEDFRSDIYSLGGTLFHALAGRPPYEAETGSMVALKQLKSQPVSLQAFAPDVSSETAYVVNRMLSKNPEDRYASYPELIEHLGYARNKLIERIKAPPQPKARVVLETKETRNFTAWITLVLLLVVIAAAGALFVYRDQLFPEIKKNAVVFSETEFDEVFARAVDLAATGQLDDARKDFQALLDMPGITQPRLNWALMNLGLTELIADNRSQAAATFQKIKDADLFSTDPANADLANFFVNASGLLTDPDKPVEVASAQLYSSSNFEAFAYLLFGMHNWGLGDLTPAERLLRSFATSPKVASYPWMAAYKPLAKSYFDEARLVNSLKRRVDALKAKGSAASLLPDIEAAREKLSPNSKAAELLEEVRASAAGSN